MKTLIAGFLTVFLLLLGPVALACRVCRPKVEAGIYTPEYSVNLLALLVPIGALLLLAVGVFYASAIKQRFTTSSSHG
jgi:hypothetical protein